MYYHIIDINTKTALPLNITKDHFMDNGMDYDTIECNGQVCNHYKKPNYYLTPIWHI